MSCVTTRKGARVLFYSVVMRHGAPVARFEIRLFHPSAPRCKFAARIEYTRRNGSVSCVCICCHEKLLYVLFVCFLCCSFCLPRMKCRLSEQVANMLPPSSWSAAPSMTPPPPCARAHLAESQGRGNVRAQVFIGLEGGGRGTTVARTRGERHGC